MDRAQQPRRSWCRELHEQARPCLLSPDGLGSAELQHHGLTSRLHQQDLPPSLYMDVKAARPDRQIEIEIVGTAGD